MKYVSRGISRGNRGQLVCRLRKLSRRCRWLGSLLIGRLEICSEVHERCKPEERLLRTNTFSLFCSEERSAAFSPPLSFC